MSKLAKDTQQIFIFTNIADQTEIISRILFIDLSLNVLIHVDVFILNTKDKIFIDTEETAFMLERKYITTFYRVFVE
jgi:hypothetical protein